jgi:hypothetical protein
MLFTAQCLIKYSSHYPQQLTIAIHNSTRLTNKQSESYTHPTSGVVVNFQVLELKRGCRLPGRYYQSKRQVFRMLLLSTLPSIIERRSGNGNFDIPCSFYA